MCGHFSSWPSLTRAPVHSNAQGWLLGRSPKVGFHFLQMSKDQVDSTNLTAMCCWQQMFRWLHKPSELTLQVQECRGVLPSCAPGPSCSVTARGSLRPKPDRLYVTTPSLLASPCSQK